MGLISKLSILALGVGIGYYAGNQSTEKRQTDSTQKIAELEQKYQHLKQKVVGTTDISIDYVVAEKQDFSGLVFTDKQNGQQGVLMRNQLFGGTSVLSYATLDGTLASPTAQIAVLGSDYKPNLSAKGWTSTLKELIDKMTR